MAGDHKPVALLRGPFNETQGVFSPDGKWLAYQSDESGIGEVYVQAFTGTSLLPVKIQVSNHGGGMPHWGPDGKEILYEAPTTNGRIALMAAAIHTENRDINAEAPRELFDVGFLFLQGGNVASWVTGGDRVLVLESASPADDPLTVVVNWQAGFKK
jgi:roadblock/LC7 domain-containing protein